MKNTDESKLIKSKQVQRVLEGLKLANKRMIDFKKMKKTPVVIAKDGEILHLDPFNISMSEYP
jgi:hypothetical protein